MNMEVDDLPTNVATCCTTAITYMYHCYNLHVTTCAGTFQALIFCGFLYVYVRRCNVIFNRNK